ncbi:MAG: DUF2383 domain-containing protein [Bdellovibrionota bacterium]
MLNSSLHETQERINELLRGERSAVETYHQAFAAVGDDPRIDDLRAVAAEHRHAVQMLVDRVIACGGEPSHDSGIWGTWTKTVLGTATLFGEKASLSILKEGEEHGKNLYLDFLKDADVDPICRDIIENELLPQQVAHIQTLERIIRNIS